MENTTKKNIDWSSIGFGYIQTDYRYVSNFKDGAWDEGTLTEDPNVVLNECCLLKTSDAADDKSIEDLGHSRII